MGGQETFSGDRYGNMSYDGAKKLSEIARFLRGLVDKNLVPAEDLKKLTIGQFFESYKPQGPSIEIPKKL